MAPNPFPLDSRYHQGSEEPMRIPPKDTYYWNTKKLMKWDPRPGNPGYFGVLTRLASDANIENRNEFAKYISQGQKLFRQCGITSDMIEAARNQAKEHLESRQQEIDRNWGKATNDLSVKDVGLYDEWIKVYAEMIAYGETAAPIWVTEKETLMSGIEERLQREPHIDHEAARKDLRILAIAVKSRIRDVLASYTNEFEQLYKALGVKKEAEAFIEFEKTLSITPIVTVAPSSAPWGLGLNALYGITPCADVVVSVRGDGELYVGIIEPSHDPGVSKMLGGKCDPKYDVASDGSLCVSKASVKETALIEFMQETGADQVKKSFTLNETQLGLLDRFARGWEDALKSLKCGVSRTDGTNEVNVTWSEEAMNKTKDGIEKLLRPIRENITVPDNRTTRNAGYLTTVYEVKLDTDKPDQLELLTLVLIPQGSDEGPYSFRRASEVRMQSTHESIFKECFLGKQ
ncbi:hypothetical protein EIK77_002435 [Talaromyces pinophilus]|nr:hypothetical protein EIK77_002435 [Talaromyces pinophilus]